MAKDFFIADTHFGDERIIRYENRPFESVAEMDKALVEKWNNVVSVEDTVQLTSHDSPIGVAPDVMLRDSSCA